MFKFIKENKGFTLYGLIVLMAIAAIFTIGLLAPPIQPTARADGDDGISARIYWQHKWQYFSGTACETITIGQALTMSLYTGGIGLADCDAGASDYVIGLAGNGAANGESVQVVRSGVLAGLAVPAGANAGLTPYGAPVFVATVAGGITTFPTNYTSGTSLVVGTVLPLSEYAADSGVTTGSDRILVNIPFATGVSPWVL